MRFFSAIYAFSIITLSTNAHSEEKSLTKLEKKIMASVASMPEFSPNEFYGYVGDSLKEALKLGKHQYADFEIEINSRRMSFHLRVGPTACTMSEEYEKNSRAQHAAENPGVPYDESWLSAPCHGTVSGNGTFALKPDGSIEIKSYKFLVVSE